MIFMKNLQEKDIGNIYIVFHQEYKCNFFLEYCGIGTINPFSHKFRFIHHSKEFFQHYNMYTFLDEKYMVQQINLPFDVVSYIHEYL